jgi:hypothetical protein
MASKNTNLVEAAKLTALHTEILKQIEELSRFFFVSLRKPLKEKK